jgi:hypothetical protein
MTNIRHVKNIAQQRKILEQATQVLWLEYAAFSAVCNNIHVGPFKPKVEYIEDRGWKINSRLYKMDAQAVICRLEEATDELRRRVKEFKAIYPEIPWWDEEYTDCTEPRTIRVSAYVNRQWYKGKYSRK